MLRSIQRVGFFLIASGIALTSGCVSNESIDAESYGGFDVRFYEARDCRFRIPKWVEGLEPLPPGVTEEARDREYESTFGSWYAENMGKAAMTQVNLTITFERGDGNKLVKHLQFNNWASKELKHIPFTLMEHIEFGHRAAVRISLDGTAKIDDRDVMIRASLTDPKQHFYYSFNKDGPRPRQD